MHKAMRFLIQVIHKTNFHLVVGYLCVCRQLGSLLIINEGEVPNALPKWNRYSLSEVHDGQWVAETTGGTAS